MSVQGTLQIERILRRVSANLAVDATINTFARALGHKRLVGQFAIATNMAPAAGYPRIRWSNDGSTFQIVRLVSQDVSQTALNVYTFDVPVEGAYVAVEFTNGNAQAGNASAWAELRPE